IRVGSLAQYIYGEVNHERNGRLNLTIVARSDYEEGHSMFAIGMPLLFLALAAGTPAQAAFTTAEAAQIEHIRLNVVGRLGSAFQAYQVALAQNQDTLVMRQGGVLHTNYAK